MRFAPALAFATALLTAPADARPPPAAGPSYHYTCQNGRSFDVRYDKDHTVAFVDFGSKHYLLPAAISASGSRYARGRVEFWEHHGEAMLNGVRGGDNHSCKTKTRG